MVYGEPCPPPFYRRKKDHRSFEWPRERGTRRQNHSSALFECKQMHDLLVIIVLIRIVLIRFSTRNSRYLISEFNKSECTLSCISPLDKQYDILSSLETRLNTHWRSFSWIKTNNINSILHDTTQNRPCSKFTHTHCNLQFRSYKQCSEQTMDSMWVWVKIRYPNNWMVNTTLDIHICGPTSVFLFGQPIPRPQPGHRRTAAYAFASHGINKSMTWLWLVDWCFATSSTMASMASMAIDEL